MRGKRLAIARGGVQLLASLAAVLIISAGLFQGNKQPAEAQGPAQSTMEQRLEQIIEVLEEGQPGPVDAAMDGLMENLYGGLRILPSFHPPVDLPGGGAVNPTEQWHVQTEILEMQLAGTLEDFAAKEKKNPDQRRRALDLLIEQINEVARAVGEVTLAPECQPDPVDKQIINTDCLEQFQPLMNEADGHEVPPGTGATPVETGYSVKLRSPLVPSWFGNDWEEDVLITEPIAMGQCVVIFKETKGLMLRIHFRGVTVVRDPWATPALPRGTLVPIWAIEFVPSEYGKE